MEQYNGKKKYVYLSYSGKDFGLAMDIADSFCASLNLWWNDYPDAKDPAWRSHVNQKISGCEVFICLISKHYAEDKALLEEIKLAKKNGKTIIPLLISRVPLTDWDASLLDISSAEKCLGDGVSKKVNSLCAKAPLSSLAGEKDKTNVPDTVSPTSIKPEKIVTESIPRKPVRRKVVRGLLIAVLCLVGSGALFGVGAIGKAHLDEKALRDKVDEAAYKNQSFKTVTYEEMAKNGESVGPKTSSFYDETNFYFVAHLGKIENYILHSYEVVSYLYPRNMTSPHKVEATKVDADTLKNDYYATLQNITGPTKKYQAPSSCSTLYSYLAKRIDMNDTEPQNRDFGFGKNNGDMRNRGLGENGKPLSTFLNGFKASWDASLIESASPNFDSIASQTSFSSGWTYQPWDFISCIYYNFCLTTTVDLYGVVIVDRYSDNYRLVYYSSLGTVKKSVLISAKNNFNATPEMVLNEATLKDAISGADGGGIKYVGTVTPSSYSFSKKESFTAECGAHAWVRFNIPLTWSSFVKSGYNRMQLDVSFYARGSWGSQCWISPNENRDDGKFLLVWDSRNGHTVDIVDYLDLAEYAKSGYFYLHFDTNEWFASTTVSKISGLLTVYNHGGV